MFAKDNNAFAQQALQILQTKPYNKVGGTLCIHQLLRLRLVWSISMANVKPLMV
jgi:hypothetical protein